MPRLGGVDLEADLAIWSIKVANRIHEVPQEAARLLVEDVRVPVSQGGNMPVRYGNLRNSIEVNFTGGALADKEYPERPYVKDPTAKINATLLRSRIGAIISISFRAIYAPKQELKRAFVRLAAQKWAPVHVAQAVRNVIARNP